MIKMNKRLEDLLLAAGVLTQEQLEKALRIQQETGERLMRVIRHLGYITEDHMIRTLELQLGVRQVALAEIAINREVADAISVTLAERHQVIPIKKQGRQITLAMTDPTNFDAIDDVHMMTGCEVQPVIAAEREILRAIEQAYGVKAIVDKAVNRLRIEDQTTMVEIQTADEAPVVSIVNSLISQAVKDQASDIHVEPEANHIRVRFRVDGVLREMVSLPKSIHAAIISRIKIMSGLDIAEKRLPQDGRLKVQEQGRDIDLRISTLPTILGEKIAIRILDKDNAVLAIKELGFRDNNLLRFRQLIGHAYGMLLVTGPTSSGKTTTLYSTLTDINSADKNIITVEDPVEMLLDGINQVQVNNKAGLTFANALRSILRQDPNVIMVGEIRDTETADIAIRAALTGHLVFSTLHTNDAPGALPRLIDMGIEPFLVASSVLGVVAQRLVRLICNDCKQSYTPEPASRERLLLGLEPTAQVRLYRGEGCAHCGYTGYRGRIPIHEVMPVTAAIRKLIAKRAAGDELGAAARSAGMSTMGEDGIHKVMEGLTTIDEVIRVAYTGL